MTMRRRVAAYSATIGCGGAEKRRGGLRFITCVPSPVCVNAYRTVPHTMDSGKCSRTYVAVTAGKQDDLALSGALLAGT